MRHPSESWRIEPGQRLSGAVEVPGDKSISHRAVMLGGIAAGTQRIFGFLESEDCRATLAAFAQMGVRVRRPADRVLELDGVGHGGLEAPAAPLDLGNSGTGLRLLIGLLAGQGIDVVLTGDASLRSRPMERVADPLRRMGARIETRDGCAPVRIRPAAGLRGIRYELPVASAQIKSALLLAGLSATGKTEIVAPGPSRDHTERMLRTMGVSLDVSADGLEVALEGPQPLVAGEIQIPGDLSSAAFFLVAGCLAADGPFEVRNVGINPTRDGILRILDAMGARITLANRRELGAEPVADIRIEPGELHGIEIDASLVALAIDELPVLFVAATAARGRTVVRGAAELRVKESDRLAVMAEALQAVGARVTETADGMIIEGGRLRGGSIDSRGDHRVAMSLAVAALVSEGPIAIADTAPVATSFPGFVDVARMAGLAIGLDGTPAA